MDIQAFIDSGNLEQYCFGSTDASFNAEVEALCVSHPEIKEALSQIEETLEHLALSQAVVPRARLKNIILAAIEDHIDLDNLPPTSKYSNYESWLKAVEHLIPAEPFDDFFAQVLQQNERIAQTLVVTKLNVPEEVHEVISESFFILQGTCTCTVGDESYTLNAGDHLNIPLHTNHDIRIDSLYVIAILQHQFA